MFCFKKKDPYKIEVLISESNANLDKAESKIEQMKATLNGEEKWFLVLESETARNREKTLQHKVEEICLENTG